MTIALRVADRHRRAFEEKRNRHLKDLGEVLKAAGADAVGTLLVFLKLLERQAEGIRDIGLAHVEHEPPHSQAAADMLVGGIDSVFWHSPPPVVERLL